MCFETSITYACGHWDTVVTPCAFRGTARCQLLRQSPKILIWYCRPGCPGVSVWPPPQQLNWKLNTFNAPPVSRYPFTASEQQPLSAVPARNVAEQKTLSPYEQAPNMLANGAQPYYTPAQVISSHDVQTPHAQVPNTSNPALDIHHSVPQQELMNQCLITRWQPFQPVFYRGRPSRLTTGINKDVRPPAQQQNGLSVPHRPRAPEAQMYEQGQGSLSDLVEQTARYVGAAMKVNRVKKTGNPYMTVTGSSSDSSETLTSGDNTEDDGDAGRNTHGADGVVDTRGTAPNNHHQHHHGTATGVNVNNSLHIDKKGRFHLGSQWQVPKSNSARSQAGTKFGKASVWSELSTPTSNNAVPPSKPETNTMFPDTVMTDRMQTLDLANLHRPHRPIAGFRDHESGAQFQATSAPLTAALNCLNYSHFETEDDDCVVVNEDRNGGLGTQNRRDHGQYQAAPSTPAAAAGSYYDCFEITDDGSFVFKEAPSNLDLSMRGVR